MREARQILSQVFGYREFRPLQSEIIENILNHKDTLVIMPTGGGKSLCYQIPAMIFEGLTLVVSPLISLMKDQVEQLQAAGAPAVFLNSSLSPSEYAANIARLRAGEIKMLYLAPEALLTERILTLLADIRVACLTIDEAHCISEWGHDFRPVYRQLIEVRQRFPDAVCTALTATATKRVREDIRQSLGFKTSDQFVASFDRRNLFVRVVEKNNGFNQLLEFLREFPEKSGIVYCFSRRQVEDLAADLEDLGFSVKPYHAGLPDEVRKQNQELFIRDDVQIIVATVAFGMGINKPNVRFVVHFDLPRNIESYYQEIGRAGRDSLRAECLLLFSHADTSKIRYFIEQKEPAERQIANAHLNAMLRYAETHLCRRKPLLEYFGEKYDKGNCGMCDNCLAGDRELTDLTIPAQKFLSCVKRTGERFGANHIIDVLRGSEGQKVLKFRHQNLSTYGIGQDYSKKQWLHLSRQFLQEHLLELDLEFGGLKLGPKASAILTGGEKFMGRIEEDAVQLHLATEQPEYDVELFQYLKKRRKQLADRDRVPPYVVFSDRSLIEMATYFPQSKGSMLGIHGVGAVKFEKYGYRFLSDICGYCRRKNVKEIVRGGVRAARGGHTQVGTKRKYVRVAEAFRDGCSVAQLQREHNVKRRTIVDHIFRFLQEGHSIPAARADSLLADSGEPEAAQAEVFDAFEKIGIAALRPIYDACDERFNYDRLSLLRLAYVIRNGITL